MEIIEKIRRHPLYQEYYDKLTEAEKGRIFCCHQMDHLLDVARIAYIYNLEEQLGIRKEIIYAAALLHDIGKYDQYTKQLPHEQASAQLAAQILADVSADSIRPRMEPPVETDAGDIGQSTHPCAETFSREGQQETFTEDERQEIVQAILGHRRLRADAGALERLLYMADKQSRMCFACAAEPECDWAEEKKNKEIRI